MASDEQPRLPVFSATGWAALWLLALLLSAGLWAANIFLGELNQDEGWYLYAARLVSEGHWPYRDFAHTQPPVMPFVYALGQPLVALWGLAGGRLFTALLGLAGALAAAWLAWRASDRRRAAAAALIAFALIGLNVYQSYFTAVVKTYALGGLLLVAGMLLLSVSGGRARRWAALAAGAALTLAVGTRISAAVVVPLAVLYLWVLRDARPWDWLLLAAGAAATAALMILPFLLAAPEAFLFDVVRYHTSRRAGGLGPLLVYKAGFISRVVQAYFVACTLLVAVVLARALRLASPQRGLQAPRASLAALLWAAAGAVSLVHVAAPVPYDDYQVMLFPLFASALAVTAASLARTAGGLKWLVLLTLLATTAGAFSSPINQGWVIKGRDRIWWRLKKEPPLRTLQRAAAEVKALAGPDGLLLTQDPYLAVEAGLRLPRGLELGPFSYYPDWTAARARACHVLNRAMLDDLLRTCPARVAAFSGYGLAIRSPEVEELAAEEQRALRDVLLRQYEPVRVVPDFGQGDTTLVIYRRR